MKTLGIGAASLLTNPLHHFPIQTPAYGISTDTNGEFLQGISFHKCPGELDVATKYMKILGANSIIYQIPWKDIEPVVTFFPSLGQAKSKSSYFSTYQGNWTDWDKKTKWFDQEGFTQIAIVGQDGYWSRPALPDGQQATPNTVEAYLSSYSSNYEHYLGINYLHIGSVVERYKDIVHNWVIAAEMNEHKLRLLYGWISGAAFDNHDFVTSLTKTQYQAIKDKDPQANVIIIFHTDIHSNIHHDFRKGAINGSLLAGPYDWIETLEQWIDFCDTIGIDAYPNYYMASPLYASDIGKRVALARRYGKPVVVTETNVPYARPEVICPSPFNYTENSQSEFLWEAYHSARQNGASGFYVFNLLGDGIKNIYTEEDISIFNVLGPAFRNGDSKRLIDFLLSNYSYCTTRMNEIFSNHENGLALMNQWGYKNAAFYSTWKMFRGFPKDYQFPIMKIELNKGYNYLYIPGEPRDYRVLDKIRKSIQGIWVYNNNNNLWNSGPSGSPEYYSLLRNVGSRIYHLKMKEPIKIEIEIVPSMVNQIKLKKGWNLIGYPLLYSLPIEQVIAPIKNIIESIHTISAMNSTDKKEAWLSYVPVSIPVSISYLREMQPGKAYWINARSQCVLNFN